MLETAAQRSDQQLRGTFFRSITLAVSVAGIILAGSEGMLFPAAFTPLIAVIAWVFVDHKQVIKIPVLLGNLLSLVALTATAFEFSGGTLERKLLAGSHLIVYLTWIVLLLPKKSRQYWWLIALCVLQIAISGILSSGVGFGMAMLGMMLLLLWTLSIFSLFRVQNVHMIALGERDTDASAARFGSQTWKEFFSVFFGVRSAHTATRPLRARVAGFDQEPMVRNGLQRDPSEVWVGSRFRGMVAGSYFVSLIIALMVFAAFPRIWVPGTSLFGDGEVQQGGPQTGFSETVELGGIGTLTENSTRVLSFEIQNVRANRTATVEEFCNTMQMDEIRFRGNVLGFYKDGKWSTGFRERGFELERLVRPGNRQRPRPEYRLVISQDPTNSPFAFMPHPFTRVTAGAMKIEEGPVSEVVAWSGNVNNSGKLPRNYTVECCQPGQLQVSGTLLDFVSRFYTMNGSFALEDRARGSRYGYYWSYSPSTDAKEKYPVIWELAQQLCRKDGELVPVQERVDRVLRHLAPENGFSYSLKQNRSDRSLDPLEDFLVNTKSGHCEYFASACVLMLQCVDVPARLVNGYYGSDMNGLSGKYEVRQRHAHAWAEALVGDTWNTLEPTPAAQRQADIAQSSQSSLMTDLRYALSDFWNDGIQSMSVERQQEFFAPVISTSKSIFDTVREQGLWTTLKVTATQFVKNPQSWISWQGGVVTFLLLLMVVGVVKLRVIGRLFSFLKSLRDRAKQNVSSRSAIRFYEGFCSLCERHGLTFPPSGSAIENAKLAEVQFAGRLKTDELLRVPKKIATAFNQVRFGNHVLSDDQILTIGSELKAFSEALKTGSSTEDQAGN